VATVEKSLFENLWGRDEEKEKQKVEARPAGRLFFGSGVGRFYSLRLVG
jgi:hypothetical protein